MNKTNKNSFKDSLISIVIIFGFIFFPVITIPGVIIYIIVSSTKRNAINNINIVTENKMTMMDKLLNNTKVSLDGITVSKTPFDRRRLSRTKAVNATRVEYPSTYTYVKDYSFEYQEPVKEAQVNSEYLKSIDDILEDTIKKELVKNKFDDKAIVPYIRNRKYALTVLFGILNFVCISFIFFHMPLWTLLLEVVNIIIFIVFSKRYTVVSYLKKQVKARPDEKIADIVSSLTAEQVSNNLGFKKGIIIGISCLLPVLVYFNPHIFYENYEDGYGVRFYTLGITNFTKAEIPETHNGRKVLSIRGNVFANIPFLKEVILPDSIEEIRGQAFLNDRALEKVNLPENLKYLGGSAFKNCRSLKKIVIPLGVTEINGETFKDCVSLEEVILHDDITSIHGETFVNCESLKEIKLPSKITEISGNTFENCSSLRSIEIPGGVTRIGGHAFYGCSSLSSVYVPDSVKEIGSSAFRLCSSLRSIEIPSDTSVNTRAFKESPTVVTRRGNIYTDYTENLYD